MITAKIAVTRPAVIAREIELNEVDKEKAKIIAKEISEKLLTNSIIEDYSFTLK